MESLLLHLRRSHTTKITTKKVKKTGTLVGTVHKVD